MHRMSGYMRQAAIREGRCRPEAQNSGAVLQGVTPCRGTHEGKGCEAARAANCVKQQQQQLLTYRTDTGVGL